MVRVDVIYEGGLHCRATHGPSGAAIQTDAPVDNQGKGEAFSPTDLVGTAMGTCMLTIMGIAAEKHGWDIEGASATIEKHMIADPQRRIAKLDVVIRIPLELDERARTVLEQAALSCPVHRSLLPGTEIPVRFEWGAPVG
ncbi:MAG: OsmC family protein [Planctomycetota bacterium]|nr:OsmC family protein [Planctomycetota bacterium]